MPFKVKGIRRVFFTPGTAKKVAKERGIKKPKITSLTFGELADLKKKRRKK